VPSVGVGVVALDIQ
jgi:hypothetical protein